MAAPRVVRAMATPPVVHLDPDLLAIYKEEQEQLRYVFQTENEWTLALSGTGTSGMEAALANLIEPGDKALVLSTGLFGDRFAESLERYGAVVRVLRFPLGETVDIDRVRSELDKDSYRLMTATHVDTSTGVRVDPRPLGLLGREHGVLTVLDGVCSVAGEVLHQEEWDIDVCFTASQKAIGVPPGLALLVASQRALEAWRQRTRPVANYYADWEKWLPVMQAYEEGRPAYFGTPAVNHIVALKVSLGQILAEGLDARERRHELLGRACRAACDALGLGSVPTDSAHAANMLSAPRYPKGVEAARFLLAAREAGATFAGGLHPEIRSQYFRIGHMGAIRGCDLLAAVGAAESGLAACGYPVEAGQGVAAAQAVLMGGSGAR